MTFGMLILLILSAVYFTRLLAKKRMFFAALGVVIFGFILVIWSSFVLTFDFASTGTTGTSSYLFNSKDLTDLFSYISPIMPLTMRPVIRALFMVVSIVVVASVAVVIHGSIFLGIEIANAINAHTKVRQNNNQTKIFKYFLEIYMQLSILKRQCRLNC